MIATAHARRFMLKPAANWLSACCRHTSAVALSDQSEQSNDTKHNRRRMRERIAPIVISSKAAEKIKELLANKPDAIGVRLGVRKRGCNGLSYTMNYATEIPEKNEEVVQYGARVFIDPMAVFYMVGTEMDYEETALSAEFTFKNPNARSKCGCGESFNV